MSTSIYWPPSLPWDMFTTVDYQPVDDRVQTQPELGPPQIRPRQALSVVNVAAPCYFTGAQISTFNTFWVTTLSRGSLRFLWRDPTTDALVEMSFRARPSWRPSKPHHMAALREWSTVLMLRIHT